MTHNTHNNNTHARIFAQEHDTSTTIEDQKGTPQWEREHLSDQRGRRRKRKRKRSRTETKPHLTSTPWTAHPQTQTPVLPGITEIVFKALRTLNVRRADTLPRFTNSVIYLQGGSDTVTHQSSRSD